MERLLKSRYKIGEKISENPFSITYKGTLLDNNKAVVIKIYRRGTLGSNMISRMKQKVKEFSSLSHHGVAKLIDGDYGWQGFYYVRDYIEGKSLQQVMESGQEIGLEKAVELVEEICRVLEFVHGKGIIHGALKPSDILINSKGIIKLTDFVIEGEIKQAMPQKIVAIMQDGGYTSPEELIGDPPTQRGDIYSMGMILLELVSSGAAAEKGLQGGLEKLRSRTVPGGGKMASLPRYLQDIISKALQPDPLLRFASMGEFRESLERKSLSIKAPAQEEIVNIFENTVTQYGGEDIDRESETLQDVGRIRIRWSKEKHRNWILVLILGAAFISGIIYVFFFAR